MSEIVVALALVTILGALSTVVFVLLWTRSMQDEWREERQVLLERIQRPERVPAAVRQVQPLHSPSEERTMSEKVAREYAAIGTVAPPLPDDAA